MKRLLIIAALLVIAANTIVFARIVYNRSSEPATITLTERELALPYNHSHDREDNSGLNLEIKWRVSRTEIEHDNWRYGRSMLIDEAKFQQFGFHVREDCIAPFEDFRRDTPRKAWVALEYDGEAHAKLVRLVGLQPEKPNQYEKRADKLAELKNKSTRLYIVDIAPHKEELLEKYQNSGQLILAADIDNDSDCQEKYKIRISNLLPKRINVPVEHHPLFKDLPTRSDEAEQWRPAYQAIIAIGKLNEPWLLSVERIK